jgi:hypothetical protein
MVSPSYPLLGGGVSAAVGAGLPLPQPAGEDVVSREGTTETLSLDFIKRLRDSIQIAQNELQTHREGYRRRLELYAGNGYGSNDENVDTPLNCYSLALRIYQRRLISGEPRALVRSRYPDAMAEAYELSLACEQLFREINLKDTIKEVVLQGLLSVGIVKVATTPREMNESLGFLHDAEQPFCDPVLLENFAYDTNAKRWEEIDWCGDRYRMPLEDLRSNPLFNQGVVEEIGVAETRKDEDLLRGEEDSVQRLGIEDTAFREELRGYVTLWDIWLPKEGLIVTLPDGHGVPLRIDRWDGPENGPYHLLRFDPIPGNIIPVAPGSHLEGLARLLNRAIRKLGDQLDRQKTNATITPSANSAGDGNTIQDANDGEVLVLQDPKNVGEVRTGGIDQASYAATLGLRDIYSWLSGNIDSLGGLSSKADTLGQQELMLQGSNSLVNEFDDKLLDFLKGVMTSLSWHLYTDPTGTRKLVKRLEGTRFQSTVNWGPERRTRDWFLFEFEVDPFSVHARTPGERLQLITQLMPVSLQMAQLQQLLQQSGGQLDMEGMWRLFTRYSGLSEFSEFLTFSGTPVSAEPKSGNRMPSMNIPGVPHEYIRRNIGSGGQQQGPGQQALAQMMTMGNGAGNGNKGTSP